MCVDMSQGATRGGKRENKAANIYIFFILFFSIHASTINVECDTRHSLQHCKENPWGHC